MKNSLKTRSLTLFGMTMHFVRDDNAPVISTNALVISTPSTSLRAGSGRNLASLSALTLLMDYLG
jgi:hypothetical protein